MKTIRSLLLAGLRREHHRTLLWLAAMTLLAHVVGPTTPASAGGSNYVVAPGARPQFAGRVREWAVPTPRLARDPAPGPDGSIYIAVMIGNKIARFDPSTETFKEWTLPAKATPHGLLVDPSGVVWYTGYGNGTIGRLDPVTGETREYKVPSGGHPHTMVSDNAGVLWFTNPRGNRIGRLDPQTGAITEYPTRGNPYGIALDRQGHVWFCQFSGDRLGKLDPRTGSVIELPLETGAKPRRMATAPDGTLWVTLFGHGKLAQVDPVAGRVIKHYALPAGEKGGPYAVNVDGAGIVWANEIETDTVVRLDPATGDLKVIPLPSRGLKIRKMTVDAQGRLWYMGSANGRLGVVE